jgi:hypothetical protein
MAARRGSSPQLVGHWIVEQRPDLVLDRLRAFLKI